jgi:nitrogen regulatory protein P-II 1
VKRIEAIVRPERLGQIAAELEKVGLQGFTIADVRGHGQSPEKVGEWRGQAYELHVTHKLAIVVIVEDDEVQNAVLAIVRGGYSGNVGDGLVTVSDIVGVYQIRAGLPSSPNGGDKEPAASP